MKLPRNAQTTSTEQRLTEHPAGMARSGGGKPNCQTSSTQIPLNHTPHPVAAFGAKPGMGTVQTNSAQVNLSRAATSPYEKISDLRPQVSLTGKGKRK